MNRRALRAALRESSLVYASDDEPGFTRKGAGRGFYYLDTDGQRIRDADTLERVRALAIPPAYREVWICPDPRGHLQATGRDAAQRKQYRYHPAWSRRRAERKFDQLRQFGAILPRLRRRVRADLRAEPLSRPHVLAAALRILDQTGLRVGHEAYLEQHGSRGLTTLAPRHLELEGDTIRLRFRGKSGMDQEVEMHHPRVARLLEACLDLPGQRLFQYLDASGEAHELDSSEINAFLASFGPPAFTSKTFRTWRSSVCAWSLLAPRGTAESPHPAPRQAIVAAIRETAAEIGNRPATCRQHYVHPRILETFAAQGWLPREPVEEGAGELNRGEREFLGFLHLQD
jgi:DNA topoisomerase I